MQNRSAVNTGASASAVQAPPGPRGRTVRPERKVVDVPSRLPTADMDLLRKMFPGVDIKCGNESHGHGFAAAVRSAFTKYHAEEGDVDIGGNWFTHAVQNRAVHSCCPLLDWRDQQRQTLREVAYRDTIAKATGERRQMLLQGRRFCNQMGDHCMKKAKKLLFVHSMYDMSTRAVADCFFSHDTKNGVGVLVYDHRILLAKHESKFTIVQLDCDVVVSPKLNQVKFFFHGPAPMVYTHNLNNLRALYTVPKFEGLRVDVNVRRRVVGSHMFFSLSTEGRRGLAYRPAGCIFLRALKISETNTGASASLAYVPFDQGVYEELTTQLMCKGATDLTAQQVRSMLYTICRIHKYKPDVRAASAAVAVAMVSACLQRQSARIRCALDLRVRQCAIDRLSPYLYKQWSGSFGSLHAKLAKIVHEIIESPPPNYANLQLDPLSREDVLLPDIVILDRRRLASLVGQGYSINVIDRRYHDLPFGKEYDTHLHTAHLGTDAVHGRGEVEGWRVLPLGAKSGEVLRDVAGGSLPPCPASGAYPIFEVEGLPHVKIEGRVQLLDTGKRNATDRLGRRTGLRYVDFANGIAYVGYEPSKYHSVVRATWENTGIVKHLRDDDQGKLGPGDLLLDTGTVYNLNWETWRGNIDFCKHKLAKTCLGWRWLRKNALVLDLHNGYFRLKDGRICLLERCRSTREVRNNGLAGVIEPGEIPGPDVLFSEVAALTEELLLKPWADSLLNYKKFDHCPILTSAEAIEKVEKYYIIVESRDKLLLSARGGRRDWFSEVVSVPKP